MIYRAEPKRDPGPPGWLEPINQVSEPVAFVELSADEASPVFRAFPREVPAGVRFYKRAGLVTDGTPDEFEALAGRCAVFRLDPLANS